MKTTSTPCAAALSLALAFPLLGSPSDAPASATETADTVRFTAGTDARVVKTLRTHHELNLDRMGSTRQGGPLMQENIGGWLTSAVTKTYVDEYVSVGDGRPQVIRRTVRNVTGHGKASLSGGRGRVEERTLLQSPLKGLTILFTWIEEEGEYARTFDHLHAKEELLQNVSGEADLIAFLPAGEVSEGETWRVDAEALRGLLAPGGDLSLEPRDEGFFARMMEVGIGGDLADVLGNKLVGNVNVTYAGTRKVDDRQLAVLALDVQIESKRDRTRTYRVGMPKEERKEASRLKKVQLTYGLQGDGELLWDLGAGRFESLALEGRETFTAEVFKVASEGEELFDISQLSTFSGQLNLEYDAHVAGEGAREGEENQRRKN